MTPPRRSLDLPDLDATLTDAQALHDHGYTQAGQWDLTQVCKHLTHALIGAVDGYDFNPPFLLRLMVKVIGMKKRMFRTRRIRAGLPAPASAVYEPVHGDRDKEAQAVAEMAAAIEKFKRARGRYVKHPGFGVLGDDEWAEFQTIHGMHHLSFLIPNQTTATPRPAVEEAVA